MPLRVVIDKRGQARISGQRDDFARYERDVISGKIPSPFTVCHFKDTRYHYYYMNDVPHSRTLEEGEIVQRGPAPLKPSGELKVPLF